MYLTIITTVLVATQVIRITQNTIQLMRNKKVLDAELKELQDVTKEDVARKRENEMTLSRVLPMLEAWLAQFEDEDDECCGTCTECHCREQ